MQKAGLAAALSAKWLSFRPIPATTAKPAPTRAAGNASGGAEITDNAVKFGALGLDVLSD